MATILIVDAYPPDREFLTTLLGCLGHRLIEAGDGAEALETIRIEHPDLVIADLLLPVLDGYEFAVRMRADPSIASTRLIFYATTCYRKVALDSAVECGVQRVLTKPLECEALLSAVKLDLAERSLIDPASLVRKLDRHQLVPPSDPIDARATVFFVDDDALMRRSFAATIAQVGLNSATYPTAEAFLEDYADQPGCLVLETRIPGMTGFGLLEALRARRMHIPAIVLTAFGDVAGAQHALRLRALDFLQKPADRRTLLSRVYYALQEDAIWRARQAEVHRMRSRMAQLTARERDLIKLLIDGQASKEIAAKLGISIRTVSIHRAHLMAKTGASNVADLVRMSMVARDL
jgi:FixJ family two-component response regulator